MGGKGARYKGMLSGILKPISLGYAEQQRDGLKAYKGFLERRNFVVWSIYCDAQKSEAAGGESDKSDKKETD